VPHGEEGGSSPMTKGVTPDWQGPATVGAGGRRGSAMRQARDRGASLTCGPSNCAVV
jgi:hypothetical protein